PYAVHDHQTRNAEVLAQGGAAILVPEPRMAVEGLAQTLISLLNDSGERTRMSTAALASARPDAAARVVSVLEETARLR
ncbi:glycosyltransferase, partial [Desulfovibrio sp. 1188_IL3213]|uniref:glycosyltransferase n=1 Tax=Desulfovibrio sp. 1188_IL3213 TaxID=3084052 RepID=UPI002FDA0E17